MFRNLKFLVVDDDPLLREVLKEILEFQKGEVVESSNGNEAFKLLQQNTFDCVISDIRMPRGDGISLAKQMLSLTQRPKLFIYSGFNDLSQKQIEELKIDFVFEKPFDEPKIIEEIAKHLGR